jgi:UDP-N-acetylglucosamine--N-acetylmuramyl-(pentapeptide) pyrophosphoryl-undecaprenol N-acetylglucosamine transferase
MKFVMAGGGTGGHVIPALAVARELKRRGHEVVFVGTRSGMEARLVPAAGFPLEWIDIGGLNRVGPARMVKTLAQLPVSTLGLARRLGRWRPAAVFSMGGYVAGPVMLAARLRRIPMVLMEPNAVPGFTNRWMGRMVRRALVNFEETVRWFPPGKADVTGVPVRPEFFELRPKPRGARVNLLITGGSRGSRTLNNAARESWPLFRGSAFPVRIAHQTGREMYETLARDFAGSGLDGEVVPFIDNMPAAFEAADIVVCRSGAVAEVAAARKPAILVPFPFASDDHQTRNAEVLEKAGAARLVPDAEMTGKRLFDEVDALASASGVLERMAQAAGRLARPCAAEWAADALEEAGKSKISH